MAEQKKQLKEENEVLVRILGHDIPGNKKLYVGLTKIKGISWNISNVLCNKLKLNKDTKISDLNKETINKIEKALESLDIFDFLKNRRFDLDTGEEIFFRKEDLVELSDGTMSMRLVGASRKDRNLRVLHETYPAGGDTGNNLIVQKGEEAGVVVRGKLEVTVGERVKVLGPGDAYYFNAEIPHRFRNVGDGECEVVSAATPPSY